MGENGPQAAIERLIDNLASSEIAVRDAALMDLLEWGAAAVDALIVATSNRTGRACWEAASVLGQIDDPRALQHMRKLLVSPNPLLGQVAVQALERRGGEFTEVLIAALPESHYMARMHIVVALGKLADKRAVEPLMKCLEITDSPALRYTLIEALGLIGDPRPAELIASFQNDEDHHVRKRAQLALQILARHSKSE